MEDNVITIKQDMWELNKEDNLWYVHVGTPFECNSDTETIMEFSDDEDYINEHKEVFDSFNNGYTGENEVVISCDIKPNCDVKVTVKTLEDAGGRIMYDKDGNPEYIPDNNGFDMFSALGGMMGSGMPMLDGITDTQDIIDAATEVIKSEEAADEVK